MCRKGHDVGHLSPHWSWQLHGSFTFPIKELHFLLHNNNRSAAPPFLLHPSIITLLLSDKCICCPASFFCHVCSLICLKLFTSFCFHLFLSWPLMQIVILTRLLSHPSFYFSSSASANLSLNLLRVLPFQRDNNTAAPRSSCYPFITFPSICVFIHSIQSKASWWSYQLIQISLERKSPSKLCGSRSRRWCRKIQKWYEGGFKELLVAVCPAAMTGVCSCLKTAWLHGITLYCWGWIRNTILLVWIGAKKGENIEFFCCYAKKMLDFEMHWCRKETI